MSGRKVGKRKRRALEATSGRWPPPSRSKKDVGCQVNFFEEELCLKNTSTVEVEMITPLSLERTAVSEMRECANDDMVSVERLQDFLRNCTSPCNKALLQSSEEPKESEENKEIIRKVDGFFQDKDHDPEQLTKKHLHINQSPLVICTSEKLQKSVLESKCSKCRNSGTPQFWKVSEAKTGILKLDFFCSECKKEFTISTSDEIIRTRTKPKTYLTNYILLAFIVTGQYYKDYDHVMGTLGMSHFSKKQWIRGY